MNEKLIVFGCKSVTLHVKTNNQAAVRFYLANGFHKKKFLEEYYIINDCPYNAFKMSKSFQERSASLPILIRYFNWIKQRISHFFQLSSKKNWGYDKVTNV
jgi:hypothetical protein